MTAEFPFAAQRDRAAQAIVETARRIYERGYCVAGDGNVSVRLGDRRILITPTASRKGFLQPDDIVLCDLEGQPIDRNGAKPSSEVRMHVLAYQMHPRINAVVHAHPPVATAHTIAGQGFDEPIVPEAYTALGNVPTVGYYTPATEALADALMEPLQDSQVLMLERHGSLTLGHTLDEAFDRLEILEHTAKIALMAHSLAPGRVAALSSDQLALLDAAGLGPRS